MAFILWLSASQLTGKDETIKKDSPPIIEDSSYIAATFSGIITISCVLIAAAGKKSKVVLSIQSLSKSLSLWRGI